MAVTTRFHDLSLYCKINDESLCFHIRIELPVADALNIKIEEIASN